MVHTKKIKQIALITSAFPPLNISGAIQLRDLSKEFVRQDYCLTVMVPTNDLEKSWELKNVDGVQVFRVRTPKIRDIGYLRRALGELILSYIMLKNIKKSPLCNRVWDAIIGIHPQYFGPLVKALKEKSNCKSYLILRDIFPEWVADLGLMN